MVKTTFVCQECHAQYSKWQGKCDSCASWNSIVEHKIGNNVASYQGYATDNTLSVTSLSSIKAVDIQRIGSGFHELDRVLGGGLVSGAVMLLAGHPGAGKSTLLLQLVANLASKLKILYVTGEESSQQLAMRAKRLQINPDKIAVLTATDLDAIVQTITTNKPKLVIIDSVQVVSRQGTTGGAGGVTQIKEVAVNLSRLAKQHNIIMFLVGHVTKDNSIAGPRVLEHCVDASLMLESLQDNRYLAIRAIKNRFGAIGELGVFGMTDKGLREVKNPSAIFLSQHTQDTPGTIVTATWEATRALLIELQALVTPSYAEYPKRVCVGWDSNRLAMLLAVLQKHHDINLSGHDIFINMVGGIKVEHTSADLPVVLALLSSFKNKPLPRGLVSFGEIGLTGEIRPVSSGQARLKEASKQGLTHAIVAKANSLKSDAIQINAVTKLAQAIAVVV